jgi:alanyl-tRNA synthetase
VLGDGVDQKGSLVTQDKFRFDFSHRSAIAPEDLVKIENIVVDSIRKNEPVYAKEATLTQAKSIPGLRAVFGEVYPDPVRVVSVGVDVDVLLSDSTGQKGLGTSVEFCGGT